MKTGTLYSASDKALFDALTQHTVTQSALRQLFIKRGIIVSHDTPRDVLAKYFSRLVHDYDDFQTLARMFGTTHRRERMTSFRVVSSATISDFEQAALITQEEITRDGNDASIHLSDDGSIKILVRYKKFHFEKNEFKQIVTKNAVISIEKDSDAITIRGPQNEDVDQWCRSILHHVENHINSAINIDEIDLETLTAPEIRSRFFVNLISNISHYKKHDVTDVYVFKPKDHPEEINDNEDSTDETIKDNIDLGVHISRASLRGEGVLESDEFKGLTQRGFYISKIIWQAKDNSVDSDIYEFEAQFSEPESCTRFSYLARGFYKYLAPKEYAKGRTQFTAEEDREFGKLIETAARRVLQGLRI